MRLPTPRSTLFPYTTLFRSAGDFVTSDTTLTVSGTNGALAAGEKIQVSSDGVNWFDVVEDVGGTSWHYVDPTAHPATLDRKSTRLNSSHLGISYAVFCLKKK